MAQDFELENFKTNAGFALDYAMKMKEKLLKSKDFLSQGVIVNGSGLCCEQITENIKSIDIMCSNLNLIISTCSSKKPVAIKNGKLGINNVTSVAYKD